MSETDTNLPVGGQAVSLPRQTDILIAGAGPVGMTLACLLGRMGVHTLVLDKAPDILRHPRAIGTDNDGLRVCQAAGLARDAFECIPLPRLEMHSDIMGKILEGNLAGAINGFPGLAMFYQPDMEEAFRDQAATYPSVTVVRGVEVLGADQSEHGASVQVRMADGEEASVACQYVAAADGANSLFRDLIGQSFTGKDYAEDWLIVDVIGRDEEKQGPRIDHVMFGCNPHRPYPHMPAPGGRERWEFKLQKGEDPDHFMKDETIRSLLKEWYPNEDAQIERKAIYKFRARTANCFYKDRIFLLGDAAHVTPPFAGQGLVSGMRDAFNLAWRFAYVVQGKAGPGVLASYDTERRPHVIATTGLARFLGSIVMPKNKFVEVVVHSLIKFSNKIAFIHKRMGGLEMKPKNAFRHGLFLKPQPKSQVRPGSQLPQFQLAHKDGRRIWSDDAGQGAVRLIGFGCDPYEFLNEEDLARLRSIGGEVMQVCYGGQVFHRSDHANCWEDETGQAVSGTAEAGWCALVRPDQVVLADGPVAEAPNLIAETVALFDLPHAASISVEQRIAS